MLSRVWAVIVGILSFAIMILTIGKYKTQAQIAQEEARKQKLDADVATALAETMNDERKKFEDHAHEKVDRGHFTK